MQVVFSCSSPVTKGVLRAQRSFLTFRYRIFSPYLSSEELPWAHQTDTASEKWCRILYCGEQAGRLLVEFADPSEQGVELCREAFCFLGVSLGSRRYTHRGSAIYASARSTLFPIIFFDSLVEMAEHACQRLQFFCTVV